MHSGLLNETGWKKNNVVKTGLFGVYKVCLQSIKQIDFIAGRIDTLYFNYLGRKKTSLLFNDT